MTPIETKLRELEEALKVEGICSECGFEVNFRHRRGCKIEYLSVNITDEVPNLIAALREAVAGLEKIGAKEWVQGSSVKLVCTETLTSIEKILGEQK